MAVHDIEDTEFIELLRECMTKRGVSSHRQLYKMMQGRGKNGADPSYQTIWTYFRGTRTPQPWFVGNTAKLLRLNKKERCDFYEAFFRSYENF